jgi:hypothetical protein
MKSLLILTLLALSQSSGAQQSAAEPCCRTLSQLQAQLTKEYDRFRHQTWSEELNASVEGNIHSSLTSYLASRLQSAPTTNTIEDELNNVLERSLFGSWSRHPAYVFACCSKESPLYVVSYTLGYAAAAGWRTYLQVYARTGKAYHVTGEAGSEMDNCDVRELQLPYGNPHVFRFVAFGNIFGANQSISRVSVYQVANNNIREIWNNPDTLGVQAQVKDEKLILEYRDAKLFYSPRKLPDAFQDTYAQTESGLERVSRIPLDRSRQ